LAGLSEACQNLSTDMAVSIGKKFLKAMAQPFEHSQLGVSLWDERMVEEVSKKERQTLAELNEPMEIE
jgi:DNA excision repair protein ERCC-2